MQNQTEKDPAAVSLGRKGGSAKSPAKSAAAATNGKAGKKGWAFAVVVAYDCRLGERGVVVSRHATYDLARKAALNTGLDEFLAIKGREEVEGL